jgi:formylglycine-generating enzyme required for sulfatase activity
MKWLKVGAVIFGALVITSLGIDAADTLSGSRTTLLGQLLPSTETGICPAGMVEISTAGTFSCVDMYEVSASEDCPHSQPTNELQTKENIETQNCVASSVKDLQPWRFITREQAVAACMRAGKRLPKSDEWYVASVGTPDDPQKCNISGTGVRSSGYAEGCVSASGVYDAIGNVWEWVSDDVINGQYNGRSLPEAGYVHQVDAGGMATLTNVQPSTLFYDDYLWSSKDGAFGILRGGFYGSKSDAGVYSVHAETLPTSVGTAIGFRCVK